MQTNQALYLLMVTMGLAISGAAPSVIAQDSRGEPGTGALGVIMQGSGNVVIGGQPAARKGDTDDRGGVLVEGSPNVTINGRPAVTLGDRTGCGGVTVGGASNVFINGKPVARAGDMTTGC